MYHEDTPENEVLSPPQEVAIVDPGHPLYGRRFRLLSVTGAFQSEGFVRAEYRPGITLLLPLPATSLRTRPPLPGPAAKLSLAAIEALLALVGESEEACRSSPPTSGPSCPMRSGASSSTTSPRPSGR